MTTPKLFGIVTVGERGQVVIPAEAREALGIDAGDKLLVFRKENAEVLLLAKPDDFERHFQQITEHLASVRSIITSAKSKKEHE